MVTVSMKDYAQNLYKIVEIRKASRHERLSRFELNEYRQFIGKLSWLAIGTRPYISYTVSKMSEKNKSATIADLHNLNKVKNARE